MERQGVARKNPHSNEGVNSCWLQRGKFLHTVSLSVRDTHCPVLGDRFKLQPLLFEEKLKALGLKLVLPAAFQATHQLLLCSWREAGRSRLQRLLMLQGAAPAEGSRMQAWPACDGQELIRTQGSFPGNGHTPSGKGLPGQQCLSPQPKWIPGEKR